jgi:hypothetical protein
MDNTTSTTPGIKTTEFYTMLVSQIVGLLVLSGHVTSADAPLVIQYAVSLIAGVQMIITAVTYIRGRIELKKQVLENNLVLKTAILVPSITSAKASTTTDASGL